MVPWNKLSRDAQRAILGLIIAYQGTTLSSCCPVVCDPPPRPSITAVPPTSAGATRTPIICDPAPSPRASPPPRTATRTPGPIICDPAPTPFGTSAARATLTAAAQRRFQLRSVQLETDPTLKGAAVRGTVTNAQGQPLAGISVIAQMGRTTVDIRTGPAGAFALDLPGAGDWTLVVGGDRQGTLRLYLKQSDVAIVEWREIGSAPQTPLPLAEIRTVDIVWEDELTFSAATPWTAANYRWSVSGGTLVEAGGRVKWEPPAEPGRYLLQLIADWGPAGIAVDARTLTVLGDGGILVG